MADTYASRDARRRAAMAEALMGSAMTAPQGGMVGRYYVGEGIGGGLARIGQALMANRIGGKADEAEAEYQAGQKAARAKSMEDLVSTISTPVTDVRETADGVGPMPMRKPSNQEIGAALLKYQNDTGSEIPKDIIGLMAPGAGGNDTAFGSTLRKDGRTFQLTKSGQLIDLGEGFDEPNRVLDLGGQLVVTPTSGAPKPVAIFSKGVSPDKVYDVQAAPEKASAVAAAEAEAKRKQDQIDKAATAGNAVELLDRYIAAVNRQPRTAAGRGIETVLGVVGAGNEGEQNAMADAENIGASIVTYAQKQPGPSSDKDVQNYMTQVGILGNKLATREQRLSAARSAKTSYLRVVQKYGTNWQPSKQAQPSKTANPFD